MASTFGGGLLLAAATTIYAQAPQHFLTATIKPSVGPPKTMVSGSATEMIVRNTTLRSLIRIAYQLRDFQITGSPAWLDTDLFDIDAKSDGTGGKSWPNSIGPKLQSLLKDRFKLKAHREMRESPVYSLTVAKDGVRIRQLKEGHCATFEWRRSELPPGKLSPEYCGAAETGPNLRLNRVLDGYRMSIGGESGLITVLSRELDRIVIDKTGLTGQFDIRLEWNRDAASTDEESPSIFTAVEQQLGLKLESDRGPVEMLVVDQAEKPAGN